MGSIALTAPQDWGWACGSTLYGGVVNGFSGAGTNTDLVGMLAARRDPGHGSEAGCSVRLSVGRTSTAAIAAIGRSAVYTSYQATEKLSLHLRGEYLHADIGAITDFDVDKVRSSRLPLRRSMISGRT